MAHGGHGKQRSRGALVLRHSDTQKKIQKKSKMASLKNQMRSIQRLLQKNPTAEVKDVQQKRLEDLKKQTEQHRRAELERKMSLRYRRVKFFERRKIERAIKRIEKPQEAGPDVLENAATAQKPDTTKQLAQLKEDLEYVRFFPKTEKYVSLFMGHDDEEVIAKRSKLREQIKANLVAAAATGIELEEMENDEEQVMEVNDDDFFLAGGSSDDAEADDEWNLTTLKPEAEDTAKMLPAASMRHTSGHKNHQQHQRAQKLPSSSQFRNQRPQSTASVLKNKASQFRNENHNFQTRNSINKKQKTTTNPLPLGNPSPSYSRATNDTSKISSSALSSKNNAGPHNVCSTFIKPDTAKVLPIPEVDCSNLDAKKKRQRKHRPKKKKT